MSIVLPSTATGKSLCDYRFLLRRLLHDPSGRMYPDEDLTLYLNIARERIARDSACLRPQQDFTLLENQDTYPISALPLGPVTIDVLGISVYWGNLKYQLAATNFMKLDTWLRTWTTNRQRPTSFARNGGAIFVVGPVPDQDYACKVDTVIIPAKLVTCDDAEEIPIPFQDPIPFFAAYYAKMYEQSFGESQIFLDRYVNMLRNAMVTWRRRLFADPYGVS